MRTASATSTRTASTSPWVSTVAYGTPTYLLRQAIERGHAQGYLKTAERDELATALEARHER